MSGVFGLLLLALIGYLVVTKVRRMRLEDPHVSEQWRRDQHRRNYGAVHSDRQE